MDVISTIKKGKKTKFQYNGINYDSKEEIYFAWYLMELRENDYIKHWLYQPHKIEIFSGFIYKYLKFLKTKNKEIETALLQPHIYTPDFKIFWSKNFSAKLFYQNIESGDNLKNFPFIAQNDLSTVDVKPAYDMQNMTRLFTINQKWIWDKKGIYIQKIIPFGKNTALFPSTFTPQRFLSTDKGKQPRKLKYEPQTLSEFVKHSKKTNN